MRRACLVRLIALASVALGACTVHQTESPGLAGPSEFATSIEITATPDHVRQDGVSQSFVAVRARDANGRAIAGLGIRLEMSVGGTRQDFGTLSERNVVTNSDGRAAVNYTAPPSPPTGVGGSGTTMSIMATAVGTNSQLSITQSTSIELVPPGVILAPGGAPTAAFVISPTPVNVGVAARFDASSSLAGQNSSGITSYAWSFGDGATAAGAIANHAFSSSGTFNVTLTVTNDRGLASSATTPVTVVTAAIPTAAFVFSPTQPGVGTQVQFNAQPSTAASGRTITQYLWNWGDGESGNGMLEGHDYAVAGNYRVVLTVIDDLGQRDTTSQDVPVGVAAVLTADFEFTPAVPQAGTSVVFDASLSTPPLGGTIRTYSWSWGDGTSDIATVSSQPHIYRLPGPFNVVLTVTAITDNTVTTKTKSRAITVVP